MKYNQPKYIFIHSFIFIVLTINTLNFIIISQK